MNLIDLLSEPGVRITQPSGRTLLTSVLDITNAQLLTLASVPLTQIPDPGAGLIIVPVSWSFELTQTTALGANTNVTLQYRGLAVTLFSMTPGFNNPNFTRLSFAGGAPATVTTAQANYANKGIQLVGSADNTLGTGTNKYRSVLSYYTVPAQ